MHVHGFNAEFIVVMPSQFSFDVPSWDPLLALWMLFKFVSLGGLDFVPVYNFHIVDV